MGDCAECGGTHYPDIGLCPMPQPKKELQRVAEGRIADAIEAERKGPITTAAEIAVVITCHPACKCREKKVEELVDAVRNSDGYEHASYCPARPYCSDRGDCICGHARAQAAIEGVKP